LLFTALSFPPGEAVVAVRGAVRQPAVAAAAEVTEWRRKRRRSRMSDILRLLFFGELEERLHSIEMVDDRRS
jgi:hypothetical protein